MTMLLVMLGLYLAPQAAVNLRWLVGVAAALTAAGLIAWFGWAERQPSSYGSGVAGLLVLMAAGAAGLGVLVRALVLWRGWQGRWVGLAVALGAGLILAALAWIFEAV
ncbi:MAG: hypothetical protein Q8M59_18045 [Tabrizicola sp.]|uniref:hypothetical protein n=1 Tax=Tabrizicola sp. TaxID=2005166 RepID=UPI0027323086|nr:hypothetical protein [Tabrizicola sp.]MDP3264857.1 hypothetical protein [Tabrizicola sp.]